MGKSEQNGSVQPFFETECSKIGVDLNKPGWPDDFGKALRERMSDTPRVRVLSLFSGAGGLDIGFRDCGFDIVESVEIEPTFCQTLKKNLTEFDDHLVRCIDIRNYEELPKKIDFIIGGPPCQTFSAAGRRANGVLGTTDARGVLFKEYVRILDEIKPKGFLFENVYGIVGAQKGEPWKEIIRSFSEIGYKLYYRILDSADYGVPQHRERLIIVGLKEGSYKFPRPLFGPDSLDDSEFYTAGQAVEGADHSDEPPLVSGRYSELLPEIPPGLNYSFFTEELGNPNPVFSWRSKFSDFLYKADPDAPVRTIKAQGGQWTGPLHWDNRHFSISEYKRLQTFPDSYKIEGSKAVVIKQIGNSVPPQFARILAMSIADQIFGMDLPLEISYLEDGETLNFRSRKALLTKKYREVAAQALSGNNAPNWIETDVPEYMEKLFLNIGENFGLTSDNKIGKSVLIRWGKEFTVVITDTLEDNPEVITSFNISPKNGWNLGIEEINARICTEDVSGYVMAWKVIEGEINRRGLKADLVQLNGYYQYPSKIRCELKTTDTRLSFLEHIVDGSLTQRFISSEELSKEWDVPIEEVMERAEFMRTLGYEIRNHNTNPQIEEGFWLIPYPFPTLTPRSIQLHKKLR